VAREPVALIETRGLPIRNEDADAVVRAVAHLLLAQKRRFREHPEEEASGPLVVDLDDLWQHRLTCTVCSEQATRNVQSDSSASHSTTSLFDEFPWGMRPTEDLVNGSAARQG
jgi:hypothetical protein